MIVYNKNIEEMVDWLGNKPRVIMTQWKRLHFGLFKMWLKYSIFNMLNPETNTLLKDKHGKLIRGKWLSGMEIKWSWK